MKFIIIMYIYAYVNYRKNPFIFITTTNFYSQLSNISIYVAGQNIVDN